MNAVLYFRLLTVAAVLDLFLAASISPAEAAAINCNGGTTKAVFNTIADANFSTSSTTFELIPGASISVPLSGALSDTYTLTFSGQASATGGGSWDVEAVRSIDGGAFGLIPPVRVITFHSGNKPDANSMTWCNRISARTSIDFRVLWRKTGGGTAAIGGYTMQVVRSE
jgi:hypothetical protein